MSRRCLIAALLTVPLAALAAQAATAFRDIPPGHWARKPASILADHKIMVGRTPVDFAGEVPLTRYELARMLSQLYNVEGPPATFVILRDMPPGHDATLEVQRTLGYELLRVRRPGAFEGDEAVSRKEIAEAFDTLLEKNGVAPPQRRRSPVLFSDVPASSKLYAVLDRVVNRYGLLDGKTGTPFYPNNAVTRFQVLAMLLKAMPYLNAQIDREIREATRPTPPPPPSPLPSGASPPPATPTPEVSEEPTVVPFTPIPTAAPSVIVPSGGPLLRTRARAQGELLVSYGEDLPAESGATVAGEPRQFGGSMLGGGGVAAEWWGHGNGASLAANTYYIGFDVPHNNAKVPIDMLDTFVSGTGWLKAGAGSNWEMALGGTLLYRKTYNLTGKLIGQYYLTADKDYFGVGPAVLWSMRTSPDMELTAQAQLYPLFQSYILPRGAKSLTRWGSDLSLRGSYSLGGGLSLDAGVHAFLSGALSGGNQTMIGGFAGATMEL